MKAQTVWESCKVEGSQLVGKVKELVREGNGRRVVVKQRARSLVEQPPPAKPRRASAGRRGRATKARPRSSR